MSIYILLFFILLKLTVMYAFLFFLKIRKTNYYVADIGVCFIIYNFFNKFKIIETEFSIVRQEVSIISSGSSGGS